MTNADGVKGGALVTDGAGNVSFKGTRTQTTASTVSLAINVDNIDASFVTALAVDIDIPEPTGTPHEMQIINIRLFDDGTPRLITFNAVFVGFGSALPTTTTVGKTLLISAMYNAVTGKYETLNALEQ